MIKITVLLTGLALAMLFSMQANPQSPVAYEVPVGGIILWWGRAEDIPYGFEACDGTVVSTQDAVLKGVKPNFEGKFARGAIKYRSFVPTAQSGGGSDKITITARNVVIDPHTIKGTDVPMHTHGMNHVHNVGDHKHGGVPEQTQGLHDVYSDGNANNDTRFVKTIEQEPATDTTGITDPASPTPLRTGGPLGSAAPFSVKNDTDSNRGPTQLVLNHKVSSLTSDPADNRPVYLDIVFLIRVK